jgi:hypothetical protein
MIFHGAKRRCICSCPRRGYFIAPRGNVSAHAHREGIFIVPRADISAHGCREDISLRQEEMFQRICKERIASRVDVSAHAQREDISR